MEAWEKFIFQGEIDSCIRPVIRESWKRCLQMSVDPFSRQIAHILTEREFKLVVSRNEHLMRVARPYINLLYGYVKGSGFVIFLTDKDGIVLILTGDQEQLEFHRRINLMERAIWTEKEAGTNAVGTAIVEQKPLQVVGGEHFCAIQHGITCSGCPIFGPEGEFLGVLNMSASSESVNPHTLGMVVASAKAIENQLKIEKALENAKLANTVMKNTLEAVPKGIVTVDAFGNITQINSKGIELLNYKGEGATGKSLLDMHPEFSTVLELVKKGSIESMEVVLEEKGSRIQLSVGGNSFFAQDGSYQGAVLTLEEQEQLFHLVNSIEGNRAEFNFNAILGNHPKMMRAKEIAKTAALTNSTVLLLGESGTGKELFAHAIHQASRRKGPFIAVNCSAIPRSLIESELFGYEPGSFTGATKTGRPGKFERANNGTIFLDEIGDMPLDLQAVLLRVLQEREVVRVGGFKPIPINVRVIAATNRNLEERIKEGMFREDLFFRLNVITIQIPPLREIISDLPLFVTKLLPQISQKLGKQVKGVSHAAMEVLSSYHWPGNVRELENVLERGVLLAQGQLIDVDDLPPNLVKNTRIVTGTGDTSSLSLQETEKKAIIQALSSEDSIVDAAKRLGISRSTLYRKMKQYGIEGFTGSDMHSH
ncbi:MAG TPA: sigma-54-dependent Fis family transcriptional regulator [Clostridia bacterium]|nr:sigma-54-dependent Fis family transcriptional regulator [Clostridia bacterium]